MKDKGLFSDWKVHVLCAAMTLAAEFIGKMSFKFGPVSFTLFPMLYAIIIGILLAVTRKFTNLVDEEMMETASPYIGISVMFLSAKVALGIGPNLSKVATAGAALILQELGNLGTILFAMPVAVFIFSMGRAAIGCTFGISREGGIAIISDYYGLDSDEGMGIMGGYVTGTVLGTLFCGIMSSLLANITWFHPYALAAACGTGSASMMSAQLGALMEVYTDPALQSTMSAYAATSQVLTSATGTWVTLIAALPMANWMYKFCWKLKGKEPPTSKKREGVEIHTVDM